MEVSEPSKPAGLRMRTEPASTVTSGCSLDPDEPTLLRAEATSGAHGLQRLDRRDEVVRTAERPGVARERVARAVGETGHALEHRRERALRRTEADEHRAVVAHGSIGHVPAEDLAKAILVGARHVRVGRLVRELGAV